MAGLLIYLEWSYDIPSFHKAKRFLGLYRPRKKKMRKIREKTEENSDSD